LDVEVSDDDGASWTLVRSDRSSHHAWEEDQVRLLDHISLSNSVRIRFRTGDTVDGSIVEALIDDICIFDVDSATDVSDFERGVVGFALERSRPSPFSTQTVIQYAIPSPGSQWRLSVPATDGQGEPRPQGVLHPLVSSSQGEVPERIENEPRTKPRAPFRLCGGELSVGAAVPLWHDRLTPGTQGRAW